MTFILKVAVLYFVTVGGICVEEKHLVSHHKEKNVPGIKKKIIVAKQFIFVIFPREMNHWIKYYM